jgi:hypothetical protein
VVSRASSSRAGLPLTFVLEQSIFEATKVALPEASSLSSSDRTMQEKLEPSS